jgi:hypothetical protein
LHLYTFYDWQDSLFSQPYVDSGEIPYRGYGSDDQAMLLTNKRVYIQIPGLPDWIIHAYETTGEQPVGGTLTSEDALIWAKRGMYFSHGFGDLWHVAYEDSAEKPEYGGMSNELAFVATDKRMYYYLCGFEVKTSIDLPSSDIMPPGNHSLFQNYPNPFNPETTITFYLPRNTPALLQIFNTEGQLIKTLINAKQPAGYHRISWDGTNEAGQRVSSGIYFYRLQTDFGVLTKKMLLVR